MIHREQEEPSCITLDNLQTMLTSSHSPEPFTSLQNCFTSMLQPEHECYRKCLCHWGSLHAQTSNVSVC